jgi:cysteine synthase A
MPDMLDAMVQVDDRWSLAAMHALSARLGRDVGGSTGTNLVAALLCARWMRSLGLTGSIVTLLCDGGERYRQTYYDDAWLAANGLDGAAERQAIDEVIDHGRWPDAPATGWRLAGELAGDAPDADGARIER